MHVRKIKKEARERFALDRYHAMLVYGAVYTLALNIGILATVFAYLGSYLWNTGGLIRLCGLIPWIYGALLVFIFLLALAPFNYGMTGYYTKIYKFEKPEVSDHVFEGFNKFNLERMIVLRLISFGLGLAFTLLLIVPGIIFAIRTSMATYLIRANPKLKPHEALKASNEIMKGHCWKYFGMIMSFMGWFLMCVLTCGLGLIWLLPYLNASQTVFYKRELQGDKTVYKNPALGEKMAASDNEDDDEDYDDDEDEERARLMREIENANAQMATAPNKRPKKEAKARQQAVEPPMETTQESVVADYQFTTSPFEAVEPVEPEPIMFTAERQESPEIEFYGSVEQTVVSPEPTAGKATMPERTAERATADNKTATAAFTPETSRRPTVESRSRGAEPTPNAYAQTAAQSRRASDGAAARPSATVRTVQNPPITGTRLSQTAGGARTVTRPSGNETPSSQQANSTSANTSANDRLERLRAERAARVAGINTKKGDDSEG